MDRILQKLLSQLLGRLMNRAIETRISYAARRGKDPADMTDEDRAQARSGQDLTKKARKISRASRKLF